MRPDHRPAEPPLSVALVGCGTHARTRLLPALARVPSLRLVALVDPDLVSAAGLARSLGVSTVRADVAALLQACRPDVAIVATPPDAHVEPVVRLLAAGVHVYLEKPLAASLEEAEEIAGWAAASEARVLVGHHLRFGRMERRLAGWLREGRVGPVDLVHVAHLFSDASRAARSGYLTGPAGGVLLEYATHEFDFLEYCLGRPIESVSASLRAGPRGAEEAAALTLRLEGGTLANLSFSSAGVDHEVRDYFGREGLISMDRYRLAWPTLERRRALASRPRRALGQFLKGCRSLGLARYLLPGEVVNAYRGALSHLVEAIRAGRPALPSVADGLRAVRLVHLARRSAATGRVLPVPEGWRAGEDRVVTALEPVR
ncbi:MAG: Gfo/Idh/MocA family oxidoreductase [Planctomycetes bacterium]|nr:Gfo/Idh/MocA family oxidoreductase [Planctomycetota bacterium]